MKKKLHLIIILLIFTLCSCSNTKENPALYQKLKELYPDAQISSDGGYYNIIENVSIEGLEKNKIGSGDMIVYSDFDSYEKDCIIPSKTIIFKGKKTDISTQYITVSADTGNIEGLPRTEIKIEVIESYYGDVKAGDFITYTDLFYVTTNDNGESIINSYDAIIPDEGELIYILNFNSDKKVYWVSNNMVPPVSLELYENAKQQNFILSNIYKKYILSNEAASDKTSLAVKELQWQRELARRKAEANMEVEKNKRIISKCDKVLALENPTQTQLMEALPEAEREIINRLVEKYSKK